MDNSIGAGIAALQKKLGLKGPVIALKALGPRSRRKDRQAFLNHYSRIKRSAKGAESPSVEYLTKIARGLGFESLEAFFAALSSTDVADTTKKKTNSLRKKSSTDRILSAPRDVVGRLAGATHPVFQGYTHEAPLAQLATLDLSAAPPYDVRTRYTLWAVVVLLTKHLSASDIVAQTYAEAAEIDEASGALGKSVAPESTGRGSRTRSRRR